MVVSHLTVSVNEDARKAAVLSYLSWNICSFLVFMSCSCPQDWSRVLKRVSFLFKLICFKKQTFLAGVLAVDDKQLTLQWPYSSALTWGNTCTERVVSTGCELNKVSVTSCVPVQCVIITHSFSLQSKSFFFSSLCCSFPSMFPPNCRLSFLTFPSVCFSLFVFPAGEGRPASCPAWRTCSSTPSQRARRKSLHTNSPQWVVRTGNIAQD